MFAAKEVVISDSEKQLEILSLNDTLLAYMIDGHVKFIMHIFQPSD